MMKLHWGVISAGNIAHDFVNAMRLHPKGTHKVVAIAARKLESAQAFAKKFDIAKAYGSYQELVDDPGVDVVYVSSIHPQHLSLCKMAIAANKPVLCEKPLAMNSKQVNEMLSLAKTAGTFFMEGFWSRCFPAMECLRQKLGDGTIGEVRFLHASFGFDKIDDPRMGNLDSGGGAVMDLLCYPVMMATLVFGKKPEKIVATGQLTPAGVDLWETVTLYYGYNQTAQLTANAGCDLFNGAIIHGSKGIIRVPYFWCPSEVITPTETFSFPLPDAPADEKMIYPRSQGMMYQQNCVRECLQNGAKECPLITHDHSRIIMEVLDEVRKQLGVVFSADSE